VGKGKNAISDGRSQMEGQGQDEVNGEAGLYRYPVECYKGPAKFITILSEMRSLGTELVDMH